MENEYGQEVPDQQPVEIPLWARGQVESMDTIMRRVIRQHFDQEARLNEQETFEESEDFDIEEEDNWISPYELVEMDEEPVPSAMDHPGPLDGPVPPPPPAEPTAETTANTVNG